MVEVTRSKRYRCDIGATASTTGVATSSAARAPRGSTSTAADETQSCHLAKAAASSTPATPNTRSISSDKLAFFKSRPEYERTLSVAV